MKSLTFLVVIVCVNCAFTISVRDTCPDVLLRTNAHLYMFNDIRDRMILTKIDLMVWMTGQANQLKELYSDREIVRDQLLEYFERSMENIEKASTEMHMKSTEMLKLGKEGYPKQLASFEEKIKSLDLDRYMEARRELLKCTKAYLENSLEIFLRWTDLLSMIQMRWSGILDNKMIEKENTVEEFKSLAVKDENQLNELKDEILMRYVDNRARVRQCIDDTLSVTLSTNN